MINTELLFAIYDKVEAEPEGWLQSRWARRTDCGTTYCLAGWACVLSGEGINFSSGFSTLSGCSIPHRAQELLGLDEYQRYELFYNTQTDLAELAEKIERFTGVDPTARPL